jgi:hypothetical protein
VASRDALPIRLRQQQLSHQRFTRPAEIVGWLGAIQAQDFTAAKWAVAQRLKTAGDDDVERAFAEGSLLRTHVMRPTWHFVTPADIRWLVALGAPRLRRVMSYYLRQHGVDDTMRRRSLAIIERELRDGRHLTRTELAEALATARVAARDRLLTNHVMGHILGWAEAEALVCSGPRRGRQFTYALLDERVPPAQPLSREESLAELTRRYFTSHGPATVRDFVWWSGLTMADARLGLELARSSLTREVHAGRDCWKGTRLASGRGNPWRAHLLPNYDEYVVAYADRAALMDATLASRFRAKISVLLTHTIVFDGQIVGTWTRSHRPRTVDVALQPFRPLSTAEREHVERALERFGRFVAPQQVRLVHPGVRKPSS